MLEILFEDECLLAVNKPAGLVVHPTYKNADGTLLDWLGQRDASTELSVVGRLDKLTSGVVIVAKSGEMHARLQRSWPDAEKEYLAVVCGHVVETSGEIDLPLGSDPDDRRRRIVRPDGASSVTRFERVGYAPATGLSLLRCRLVTGRRHQIRVHLAARGWPVAGDTAYGDPAVLPGLPRHALHASRVTLTHPSSSARLSVEAPPPAEFLAFLTAHALALT